TCAFPISRTARYRCVTVSTCLGIANINANAIPVERLRAFLGQSTALESAVLVNETAGVTAYRRRCLNWSGRPGVIRVCPGIGQELVSSAGTVNIGAAVGFFPSPSKLGRASC